jgi:hypothetical protein
MQKGIKKLRLYDQNKLLVDKDKKPINKFKKLPSLNLNLHIFAKKSIEEFDVVSCDNFCEYPGKWII